MIPLRDINPTRRMPVVTYGLIGFCTVLFLHQLQLDARAMHAFVLGNGLVPR